MTGTALIVFSGRTGLWWLRWLRPGFRHCFVLVRSGQGWLALDPLAHRIVLATIPDLSERAIAAHYRRHGCTIVVAPLCEPPRRAAPFALLTCVEAVKRVIGLPDRRVVTPWQLHCALLRRYGPLNAGLRFSEKADIASVTSCEA